MIQNSPVETFGQYLTAFEDLAVSTRLVRVFDGDPFPSPSEWDAVVIGGTPVSANRFERHPQFREEWVFLRALVGASVPCLGICCGGQALARLLGGSVASLPTMEIGRADLQLTPAGAADALFRGFPETFPAFEWHSDVFSAPPGAHVLVGGGAWHTQAYRKDSHIGLLFHLEYGRTDIARWVTAYRAELDSAGIASDGLLRECRSAEETMADLARTLIHNFVHLVRETKM